MRGKKRCGESWDEKARTAGSNVLPASRLTVRFSCAVQSACAFAPFHSLRLSRRGGMISRADYAARIRGRDSFRPGMHAELLQKGANVMIYGFR